MSYKRVRKNVARRLFNEGVKIYLLPCKIREEFISKSTDPFCLFVVETSLDEEDETKTFDKVVNAFEYYNCNSEAGYYAKYYIKEDLLNVS